MAKSKLQSSLKEKHKVEKLQIRCTEPKNSGRVEDKPSYLSGMSFEVVKVRGIR